MKPQKGAARITAGGSFLRQLPRWPSYGGQLSSHYPWKMSSGKNADTVTFGKSTALLIFRSTATLQIT